MWRKWKEKVYSIRHGIRKKLSPVHKIDFRAPFFITKKRPDELELCNAKLEGCKVIISENFPLAKDLNFEVLHPSIDNITTIRRSPLFYGKKVGFQSTLFLVSNGIKPIKAIRLIREYIEFTLTSEEAQILLLHANITNINNLYNNGEDC